MKIGSLFAGIGGLELGLEWFIGGETAWQVELDGYPRSQLARHWPNATRYEDVLDVDWTSVEPVDLICGGFPCQPFSHAGNRKGTADERWMWPAFADAVRLVRPRWVVVENVAALLADTDAFGWVLGDLAEMGFDAEWGVLRASDVGAPHQRARLFVVAHTEDERHERRGSARRRGTGPADGGGSPADAAGGLGSGVTLRSDEAGALVGTIACPGRGARPGATSEGVRELGRGAGLAQGAAPDTDESRPQGPEPARGRYLPAGSSGAAPDTESDQGRELDRDAVSPADAESERHGDAGPQGKRRLPATAVAGGSAWGPYEPAIRRWERIHGPAPDPLDDRGRLNPDLPEWMMGFPAGWTEGTRTKRLKAIGNAVVPHVAALAWSVLAPRLEEQAA